MFYRIEWQNYTFAETMFKGNFKEKREKVNSIAWYHCRLPFVKEKTNPADQC